MPSTTARASGAFFTFIKSLSLSARSQLEHSSAKKQGSYVVQTQFQFGLQVPGPRSYCTANVVDVGQPTPASHPQLLKYGEITPGITTEEYILRRKKLLQLLPEKSLAIISAAPVKMMTDVVPYTFRQDADYLYITGCQQPGGVAVLGHECGLCLFMPEAKAHDVIWQGQIAGVDAALDTFKADVAYPMRKLHEILPDMLRGSSTLFHNVQTAIPAYTKLEAFQKLLFSNNVKDLSIYTHQLRWIKSPAEIRLMKESASIACQALLLTMLHSKVYPFEGMLAAKVEYECKMRGAQRMAFNPVVGGGPNGSVIHYSRNDKKIEEGDLVLMDVGCELHGYTSDLTRTWPPCGSFSSAKEELYELILETNKQCVELCKPGASIRQIHDHSVEMLQKGLKEIGILRGVPSRAYHALNPTSIGHYLGMDIHDCSRISYDCPLKPGVVITIEPGAYIPSHFDGPQRFLLISENLFKLKIKLLHILNPLANFFWYICLYKTLKFMHGRLSFKSFSTFEILLVYIPCSLALFCTYSSYASFKNLSFCVLPYLESGMYQEANINQLKLIIF